MKVNLREKGVDLETAYAVCGNQDETLEHVFFSLVLLAKQFGLLLFQVCKCRGVIIQIMFNTRRSFYWLLRVNRF